ncbi:MAG TPA: DsrE family protein [Rhodoblastus sp.]|nr:DsrE family protein [Rhodoblastus sp.]
MPSRLPLLFIAVLALVAQALPAVSAAEKREHHIVFQLTDNDPARMTMVLDNIANVSRFYSDKGDQVEFEVVAYGPGVHMLRADTSPVKERVKSIKLSIPDVTFTACGNTVESMERAEGKKIDLLPQAGIVPAGVARLAELQEQGWSYVRP